jgi:hypothetical protein
MHRSFVQVFYIKTDRFIGDSLVQEIKNCEVNVNSAEETLGAEAGKLCWPGKWMGEKGKICPGLENETIISR